ADYRGRTARRAHSVDLDEGGGGSLPASHGTVLGVLPARSHRRTGEAELAVGFAAGAGASTGPPPRACVRHSGHEVAGGTVEGSHDMSVIRLGYVHLRV